MRKIILLAFAVIFINAISFGENGSNPDYPRVLILMDNYTDGRMESGGTASREIEKIFTENQFPVVKQNEINNAEIKDLTPVFTVYPGKAANLGKKYSASAVITGKATSDIVKTDAPYGTSVFTYQSRIEARIIKTDTGRVISMDRVFHVARREEKMDAQKAALAGAARNIAKSLMQKTIAAWKKEVCQEITVRLTCENADPEKAELLKKAFKFTKDITGVKEKSFKDGVLELEIKFLGTSGQLAWILRQFSEPVFDVTTNSVDTIGIKFVKKNKDFTGKILTDGAIQTQ